MLTIANKNGVFTAHDDKAGIKDVELTVQKDGWCKLPEGNSSNRTWIKGTELEKIAEGTEKVLPYREKQIRQKSEVAGKTWVDFLDEEDRALYETLKAKGEAKREEVKNRVLTEEEKEAIKIKKLEAELARLREKRGE